MPGCLGQTCGELLVRFFHCVRGCGCGGHPAFPAPSSIEGKLNSSGAFALRECKVAPRLRRHCEERRRRSSPGLFASKFPDRFATFAMTNCCLTFVKKI